MFKTILVPLDGSPFAEQALPMAASVARHSGGTLRLLQVLPPLADRYFWAPLPGSKLEHELHDHYQDMAKTYLEGVRERLKSDVQVFCDMLDEQIDIPEAIDTEVNRAGIDLVVMPSHGRGAIKRFWLGSVADQVYRSATVPVLLTRPQSEMETVKYEREAQIRHILVTLDGSKLAEQVLEPVLNIGRVMDADFQLVRVIPPLSASHAAVEPVQTSANGSTDQRMHAEASSYLQTIAEKLRARGAQVQTTVIVSADPAEGIVEAAAGADLIAMQTHARRGVSRLVHGSVVDNVVHNSSVPVLINRPHN